MITRLIGDKQVPRFSSLAKACGIFVGTAWLWWIVPAPKAEAVISPERSKEASLFPMPPEVQEQVRFWEKIFYHYPSQAVVLHDALLPDYLIDIIDFKVWAAKKKSAQPLSRRMRDKVTTAYLKRYRLALKRFRRMGKDALKFGAIEKRVYSVYSRSKHALSHLFEGKAYIRAQTGLADEFLVAAERAQEFLPFMEETFRRQGVPVPITRLAFVESMFNLKARSKVGASGIWQFMPQTAKAYMRINRLVDERNSPFKATIGAARLLADNYETLRSWPLAITAYNHGRAGMERAIRQVGSRDIGKIIQSYRSKSFGYASRNFYSEFLAAAKVYDRLHQERAIPQNGSATPLVPITLEEPISVHQLLKVTPLDKEVLQYFNRCLRRYAFTRYRYHKLPKTFQIFVPERMAKQVVSSLNSLGKSRYASRR